MRARRPSKPTRPATAPSAGPPPAEAPPVLSRARLRAALWLPAGLVVYGVLESLLWRDRLWGFHFYGFWAPAWLLAAPAALLLLTPLAARLVPDGPAPAPGPGARRRWLPWAVAAGAAVLFWLLRERHLFWGDSLPLSILIPQGQRFHPDEPLSLFAHHLLYRIGAGRWSGAEAVALGSVLAGAAFAGWATHWFARRPAGAGWPLAVAVLLTQGFTQLFYGHVENYSYLAVCLLLFVTLGVDFLERRRPLWPALLAALAAFAFHILGGLTVVPAAVLVACGWRDRGRRPGVLASAAVAAALLAAASLAAAGLYAGESPLARLVGGFQKVVTNQQDFQAARLLSLRHLANVWSVLWLVGPLSVPLLAALLVVLPGARFARGPRGVFLLTGAAAYLAPALLTGEGNLGAARNWDLYAAPAVVWAMAGLLLAAETIDPRQARRLLLALLALSLFHTAPWIALNASFPRTVERVLALPLPPGRGEMMLGTHYLNAGELAQAERWLRVAVGRDSTNVNAQSSLGLALARQEKLAAARAPLAAAVRLKPASPQLRADLITLLLRHAEWRAAAAELHALVTLTPRDRRAWLTLADCHLKLAQPDSAAFVLEAALGELPGDPEMGRLLADAYELWVVRHGQRSEWAAAWRALALFERRFPQDPRVSRLRAALPPAER